MIILLGFLIGFAAAVPVGPLNVFVISQTTKHDFFHGYLTGLTASFLDIVYCYVAIMGISLIPSHLTWNKFAPLGKIVGAILLIAISFRLMNHARFLNKSEVVPNNNSNAYSRTIIGAFILYVTNPTLYAFWLAIAGIVTAHNWVPHRWQLIIFPLSCGFGSAVWYFFMAKYVSNVHKQLSLKVTKKIFFGLAIFLIVLALYSLATIFFKIL
ncbi:MAG: LysE family transporter [Candidatus Aminicenantes bacterium]|nr:LysE family transporter [Candidatus Aminicenantes bacterium]